MTPHPHTAALLVVGSLATAGGAFEIDHHKAAPLAPLPLCEEVGNALSANPPMIAPPKTEEVAPAKPEPPKATPRKHKKLKPHAPVKAPAQTEAIDIPTMTPFETFVAWLKSVFGGTA